ncbi:MAG: 23S rRNA (guanosine(2251)-2'-O)-methyltransferase RlmB [Desulfovibrio sp.]|jgi:23S rRNA (guanosine2251-2'-O)-methyltransferase|nr:23S rRNA (guanosine(2251)-2'-O)-methyltransferase RlmB [Desulfovibrio sp.]
MPKNQTAPADILPGRKAVAEMLRTSPERVDAVFVRKGRRTPETEEIAALCRAAGLRFSFLDTRAFARVYAGPCGGVAARLFTAGFTDIESLLFSVREAPLPLALMSAHLQDPGNAGAIARTLYALGGAGMIIPKHNGVYLGAAAARIASGALDKLPVAKAANLGRALDKAEELGLTVYGATSSPTPRAADAPFTPVLDALRCALRLPALLVLGGEASGVPAGLEKRCRFLLHIPMARAFNSLNAAQAAAVIISRFAAAAGGAGEVRQPAEIKKGSAEADADGFAPDVSIHPTPSGR